MPDDRTAQLECAVAELLVLAASGDGATPTAIARMHLAGEKMENRFLRGVVRDVPLWERLDNRVAEKLREDAAEAERAYAEATS